MSGNKPRNSAGFSLLEVMVALSLTGLAVAVFAASFLQEVYTEQLLTGRIVAAIIGQSKLAELAMESEPGLIGGFPAPYHKKYKWQASEEKAGEGFKLLTLTVEWRDQNGTLHQKIFKGYKKAD